MEHGGGYVDHFCTGRWALDNLTGGYFKLFSKRLSNFSTFLYYFYAQLTPGMPKNGYGYGNGYGHGYGFK